MVKITVSAANAKQSLFQELKDVVSWSIVVGDLATALTVYLLLKCDGEAAGLFF